MKIYNILSAFILISVFTSCENEIPFNIKNNNPKLIVNAIIDVTNQDNYIFLAKTGKNDVDSISDATINIYINEVLREQITEPTLPDTIYYPYGNGSYIFYNYYPSKYKTKLRFNPGDKVKIEVFAESDKYHAWAEDVVPKPIEIEYIDTMTYIKNNSPYIRLKTTFIDSPNEKNFYRIALVQKFITHIKTKEGIIISADPYEDVVYIDSREDMVLNGGRVTTDNDIITQPENSYAIFDDTHLNGAHAMTISFLRPEGHHFGYVPSQDGSFFVESISIDYKIYLISITEMQFYYLRALNIITSGSYDEYLSTPVSFPSNVEGGVGFVGFSSSTFKTFSIPDIFLDTIGRYGGNYPY